MTHEQWNRVHRCPFCGNGTKSIFINPVNGDYDHPSGGWYLSCDTSDYGCGCTGPIGQTEDDAIDYWNGKLMEVDVEGEWEVLPDA